MTILDNKPPVEPLSEVSWRRIESDIFTELDRAPAMAENAPRSSWHRQPIWTLAAAAVVVAAAGAVLAWKGIGELGRGSLEPPRIVTADAATEYIVGRAKLTVAPHSAVWVRDDGDRVGITLDDGQVNCAVAPQPGRPPVVVYAGDVRVEVVGTRFSVLRSGASVRVKVTKGVVNVFHNGERSEVRAGQSWPAAAEDGGQKTVDGLAGSPAKARSAALGSVQKQPTSPKERFEHAARLEAKNPRAALEMYREIAAGRSEWSAPALFAQGCLALELGDDRQARKLLETYLARFPDGANATDARALLK